MLEKSDKCYIRVIYKYKAHLICPIPLLYNNIRINMKRRECMRDSMSLTMFELFGYFAMVVKEAVLWFSLKTVCRPSTAIKAVRMLPKVPLNFPRIFKPGLNV